MTTLPMEVLISTPAQPRPVTPLGILTQHLQLALQHSAQMPAEALENVQKALQLAEGLDHYVEACTTPESEALSAIDQATRSEAWDQRFSDGETVRHLEQEMLSGHVEGQLLKMLVHMTRADRILDIGTFTGYSALAMAEALPENGTIVACEVDAYVAEFAQKQFDRSPHGKKIDIKLGAALETLNQLAENHESFDLVFIDADKKEYVSYFQHLLDRNLLAPNGFICIDNTLLQGQPYLPIDQQSANGRAIAEFNQTIANDPRVEQVLIPLRDGVTIVRRV